MIVVFEGTPGSGKTTTIEAVKKKLTDLGYKCQISNLKESTSFVVRRIAEKTKEYQYGETNRNYLYWIGISLHLIDLERRAEKLKPNEIILVEDCWGSVIAHAEWSFVGFTIDDPLWDEYPNCFELKPLTLFLDTPIEVAQTRSLSARLKDPEIAQKLLNHYRALAKKYDWKKIEGMASVETRANLCLKLILKELS